MKSMMSMTSSNELYETAGIQQVAARASMYGESLAGESSANGKVPDEGGFMDGEVSAHPVQADTVSRLVQY